MLNTAYTAGSIVTDNNNVFIYIQPIPVDNTTRPGDDTRAEHLDVGDPMDLKNISKSGLTFTVTRRSGDTFTLTITPVDVLTAIQGMTDDQKTALRTAIGAQIAGSYAPAVHNHDGRYYQESEVDTLLDGKSNTGHNHDGRYFTETE